MEQKKYKRIIHVSRNSEIKFPNRKIHSKLFRSISPERKPLAPIFPKAIRLHKRVQNSSNTELLYRKSGKINRNREAFDKVAIEQLLSADSIRADSKQEKLAVSRKSTPDKNNSFYKKFDTNDVLMIYGIKKRKQMSMDLGRKGCIFKAQTKGNVEDYIEQVKVKSKKLREKIQDSYRFTRE